MTLLPGVSRARTRTAASVRAFKADVFRLLEGDQSRFGQIVGFVLLNLIVLNLLAVILETMPSVEGRYAVQFDVFEGVSVAIFTGGYLLRLWSCTSNPRYRHPVLGRLRFALTPLALVDVIAIAARLRTRCCIP